MNPGRRILLVVTAVGLAMVPAGLFASPERTWSAWLVGLLLVTGFGLFGPLFTAVQHLCAARWGRGLESVTRRMPDVLPVAAVAALFTVICGTSTLYEWSHEDALHAHPVVAAKSGWLNQPFLLVRSAVIFIVWILAARWMRVRPGRRSASVFVLLFGVTFTVFAFDWVMSLEPEWFSTIFAVYGFAGLFLGGLAIVTLIAIHRAREGRLQGVTEDLLHDLGRLLFAFAFFWGYIWFCQFMLIWYTNIPEEAGWFARRHDGGWMTLTYVSLALNFVVPFVCLLPAPAKRNAAVLWRVAIVVLVGRWLDLHIMVAPAVVPGEPALGIWEFGPPAAAITGFLILMNRGRKRSHAAAGTFSAEGASQAG